MRRRLNHSITFRSPFDFLRVRGVHDNLSVLRKPRPSIDLVNVRHQTVRRLREKPNTTKLTRMKQLHCGVKTPTVDIHAVMNPSAEKQTRTLTCRYTRGGYEMCILSPLFDL